MVQPVAFTLAAQKLAPVDLELPAQIAQRGIVLCLGQIRQFSAGLCQGLSEGGTIAGKSFRSQGKMAAALLQRLECHLGSCSFVPGLGQLIAHARSGPPGQILVAQHLGFVAFGGRVCLTSLFQFRAGIAKFVSGRFETGPLRQTGCGTRAGTSDEISVPSPQMPASADETLARSEQRCEFVAAVVIDNTGPQQPSFEFWRTGHMPRQSLDARGQGRGIAERWNEFPARFPLLAQGRIEIITQRGPQCPFVSLGDLEPVEYRRLVTGVMAPCLRGKSLLFGLQPLDPAVGLPDDKACFLFPAARLLMGLFARGKFFPCMSQGLDCRSLGLAQVLEVRRGLICRRDRRAFAGIPLGILVECENA